MSDIKMWGKEPFWGLGFEFDPQWLLSDEQKKLQKTLIDLCQTSMRENAVENHPWREWAQAGDGATRMPGAPSRWSAGKDLSWEPLRIERVCEVRYDHLQGDRFRHAAFFLRWRPDKPPRACRYDQLEITPPAELEEVFAAAVRA